MTYTVPGSFIYKSPKLETTQMLVARRIIEKENQLLYVHVTAYHIAIKKELHMHATTWVNLTGMVE